MEKTTEKSRRKAVGAWMDEHILLTVAVLALLLAAFDVLRLWWKTRETGLVATELVTNGLHLTCLGVLFLVMTLLRALAQEIYDGRENRARWERAGNLILAVLLSLGTWWLTELNSRDTLYEIPPLDQGVIPVVEQLGQTDPDLTTQAETDPWDVLYQQGRVPTAAHLHLIQDRDQGSLRVYYHLNYIQMISEQLAAAYEEEQVALARGFCDAETLAEGWYWSESARGEGSKEHLFFREGKTVVEITYIGPEDLRAHAAAWREAIFPTAGK